VAAGLSGRLWLFSKCFSCRSGTLGSRFVRGEIIVCPCLSGLVIGVVGTGCVGVVCGGG
jgi:hypothetical protein